MSMKKFKVKKKWTHRRRLHRQTQPSASGVRVDTGPRRDIVVA